MKNLRLSRVNKKFLGVCGGIAETYGLDPSIVRVIFILSVLALRGLPILLYLIAYAVIPKEV